MRGASGVPSPSWSGHWARLRVRSSSESPGTASPSASPSRLSIVTEAPSGVSRCTTRTRRGRSTVLAKDLRIGLPESDGLPPGYIPTGVAVGGSGTIYMSSDVESALYRFVPVP